MIVSYILYSLAALLVAAAFHEIGHYIVLRYFGVKFTFKVDGIDPTFAFDSLPSKRAKRAVYLGGIAAGMLPFILIPQLISIPVSILYLIGCHSDIRKVVKGV